MGGKSRSTTRGQIEGLTPKQTVFVREYLVDLNSKQAAIRAGYSPRTAETQGCRLFRNEKVSAAIAKAMEKRGKRVEFTADDVVRELIAIVNHEDLDALSKDRIKCLELLGKNLGMFKPVGGADNPLTIAPQEPDLSKASEEQLRDLAKARKIIAELNGGA